MSDLNKSAEQKLREQYQAESDELTPPDSLNANIRNMAQKEVERDKKPIWSWPLTPIGGIAAVLFVAVLYVYQPSQMERTITAPEFDSAVSQFKSDARAIPKKQVLAEFDAESKSKPKSISKTVAEAEFAEESIIEKNNVPVNRILRQKEAVSKGAGKEMVADISEDLLADTESSVAESTTYEGTLNQIAGASSTYSASQSVAPSLASPAAPSTTPTVIQKPKLKIATAPLAKGLEKRERSKIVDKVSPSTVPMEMEVVGETFVAERKEVSVLDADSKKLAEPLGQITKESYGELVLGDKLPNGKEVPAYIREVKILEKKNMIRVKGDHANPCSLGTLVYYQLEDSKITLTITDQYDPAVMCVQMLKAFSIDIDLSFLHKGSYSLDIKDAGLDSMNIDIRN